MRQKKSTHQTNKDDSFSYDVDRFERKNTHLRCESIISPDPKRYTLTSTRRSSSQPHKNEWFLLNELSSGTLACVIGTFYK